MVASVRCWKWHVEVTSTVDYEVVEGAGMISMLDFGCQLSIFSGLRNSGLTIHGKSQAADLMCRQYNCDLPKPFMESGFYGISLDRKRHPQSFSA